MKGTLSFISNTAGGTFTTANTVTRGIGQSFAAFCMDSTFLHNREVLHKKPDNLRKALMFSETPWKRGVEPP